MLKFSYQNEVDADRCLLNIYPLCMNEENIQIMKVWNKEGKVTEESWTRY